MATGIQPANIMNELQAATSSGRKHVVLGTTLNYLTVVVWVSNSRITMMLMPLTMLALTVQLVTGHSDIQKTYLKSEAPYCV